MLVILYKCHTVVAKNKEETYIWMISMRSDESYRESSELRCYSTKYDIF